MGHWKKTYTDSRWNGDYEESTPAPIPGTARDPADYMIVPVTITYKDTPA